jgi:hypothetical protein
MSNEVPGAEDAGAEQKSGVSVLILGLISV